jgi:ketosteroid isomerase-like protein
MYRRLVAREVRKRFADMSRGDTAAVLQFFAHDAHFHYPGDHALAGDHHPKEAIVAWFDRAWSIFGFDFEVHDVLVAGPLWRTRVATRFTGRGPTPDGRVFVNPGMQYGVIRWGRVHEDRIHLDTQLVAAAVAHADALATD